MASSDERDQVLVGTKAKEECGLLAGRRKHGWHNSEMTALFDPSQLDTLNVEDLRAIVRSLAAEDASAAEIGWEGILCVENGPTGDNRFIQAGALEWRDLPLPLMLQTVTAPGHDGAVICGRIDTIRREGDAIIGTGVLSGIDAGQEAAQLIAEQLITGVSVDMDETDAYYDEQDVLTFTHARIIGATLTPFPAFAEAQIGLVAAGTKVDAPSSVFFPTKFELEQEALVAAGTRNETIPVVPPRSWFSEPTADIAYPVQIEADGRIHGYVADWRSCHIGYANKCRTAPHSASEYSLFHTGKTLTGDGIISTGRMICKTVHPSLALNASDAAAWYHDTGACFGDVVAGENARGIWVAGAARPGVEANILREARGSDFSPDWRPIAGSSEMVAILAVNVSGLIVGEALVAAGSTMLGPNTAEQEDGMAAVGLGMLHHDQTLRSLRADLDRAANTLEILRPVVAAILHGQATGTKTLSLNIEAAPCACRKHG